MEDTSTWPVKNDVATTLGISPRTVERYCETGKLRTAKRLVPGRKALVIVHPEDVAALEAQTLKPQPAPGKKRARKPNPAGLVPDTTYITRDQAAHVLGLPRSFVDELVATGRIPSMKRGQRVFVYRPVLEKLHPGHFAGQDGIEVALPPIQPQARLTHEGEGKDEPSVMNGRTQEYGTVEEM